MKKRRVTRERTYSMERVYHEQESMEMKSVRKIRKPRNKTKRKRAWRSKETRKLINPNICSTIVPM